VSRLDRWVLALGAAALLVMAGYAVHSFRISTDLSHFIPDSDDPRLASLSRQLAQSSLTRTMILSVGGPDARAAAQRLAEAVRSHPEVLRAVSGPPGDFAETAYRLLFPHRYQLLFDAPEREWAALLSDDGIASAAAELRRQLGLPTAFLIEQVSRTDPLLTFPTLLRRLEVENSGGLQVVDGQFVAGDGAHAVVFVETRHSPFDGATQKPLLGFIRSAFDEINARQGGRLGLEESGLNRFAVASEDVVKADINRISIVSTLAIILMLLLLFRSPRIVLLSFVPLAFGMTAGIAASLALFGEIHGLTLAFGSTLIGVCVDYPIHFLNHHSLRPSPEGPHGTRRRISWALILGAATTLAGFAGLAWTSFPGMRELAVFASAGIVASFAATYWLLPPLSLTSPRPVALHQTFAEGMGRLLATLGRRPRGLIVLPLLALVLCAVGLGRVRWTDDLSKLDLVDENLRTEDARVRDEVSRMDSSRLIVAVAADDDLALAINDRVYDALHQARNAGELEAFTSLHGLITSAELQRRNVSVIHADPQAAHRVVAGFAAAGFRPEFFADFVADFSQPPPAPLRIGDLQGSVLGDMVRPFVARLGDQIAVVTLVRGVRDPGALRNRIAAISGASYFDQSELFARTYRRYRRRTLELVGIGILVMFAVVFLKYRRVRPTLAAGMPPLLAATATLSTLGALGITTNLLHLVSLLLVLSAGEDYAVFLLESATDTAYLKVSAVSIVLCGIATVLGFGLLSFSRIPALRAIGVTTSIGVALSLLLAPLALLWAPRGGAR
jgi:predicted exporter